MFLYWLAVKDFKLSYQNSETMLLTKYPYCGNLNYTVHSTYTDPEAMICMC